MTIEVNRAAPTTVAPMVESETMPMGIPAGGSESVVAHAMLLLQEASDRSRALDRSQQRARSAERRAALDDKAQSSVFKLIGTSIEAAASAVAGGLSIGGVSEGISTAVTSAGKLANASLSFAAEEQTLQAEGRGIAADEHQAIADAARADSERTTRLADRAMGHIEQIQQAQHQAAMAALRG